MLPTPGFQECVDFFFSISHIRKNNAEVVEQVDAADSKSADRKVMGVRFPPSAP